jgi:hypothetical protein
MNDDGRIVVHRVSQFICHKNPIKWDNEKTIPMSDNEGMMSDTMVMGDNSRFSLDSIANSTDGHVRFYRGELFLDESEFESVRELLSGSGFSSSKVTLTEVKTPPLIPALYTPILPPTSSFAPLPPRSTRGSLPGVSESSISRAVREKPSGEMKRERSNSIVGPAHARSGGKGGKTGLIIPEPEVPLPRVKSDRVKIQSLIREAYISISADPDYRCLDEEYVPAGYSPPLTLTTVRTRVETESYDDHFQFMNDLVVLSIYWLQGPPAPNPLLPQYLASMKLSRNGTDMMMNMVGELSNDDYYEGPDVEETIRIEAKRDERILKSSSGRQSTTPSFARKVRRSNSTTSAGKRNSDGIQQLQDHLNKLTEHVLELHKTQKSGRSTTPSPGEPAGHRALSADEIRRLEADLMKLSSDDIDYIIGHVLKDEPSVRVDDDEYELDVGALPPAKQRNLRRFVTRRLNSKDPSHGAQKLKQILRDDDRARASEQIAEQLLAAASPSGMAVAAPFAPQRISPENEEAERQRIRKEKEREEEAKRLWQLAHGDDMNDDD